MVFGFSYFFLSLSGGIIAPQNINIDVIIISLKYFKETGTSFLMTDTGQRRKAY
jgi:hypothetical protein